MKHLIQLCILTLPLSYSELYSQPTKSNIVYKMENNTDCYIQDSSETTRRLSNQDSLRIDKNFHTADSLFNAEKDVFQLNEEAVKSIRFEFFPTPNQNATLKTAPIEKPWMDFQVDLSVPKSMIDTTKVKKPDNYIRMLPYTIWTRFGEDPVYDVYVFGNKKRFEIMWKLDVDDLEEFGRELLPNAGSYNPNSNGGSVVIGNLDFIGFLYNNLNKQGRIRKHNRKYANAWKTYQKATGGVDVFPSNALDSIHNQSVNSDQNDWGLYHHSQSIKLTEEKHPKYFERPDHRLLQTTEQRSRFGTFLDPDLYALPSDNQNHDSVFVDTLNSDSLKEKTDKEFNQESSEVTNKQKRKTRKVRKLKNADRPQSDTLEELPNSMEDLYKYIQMKHQQDSIKRRINSRKDKVYQNVYEYEQQQCKLKERQN